MKSGPMSIGLRFAQKREQLIASVELVDMTWSSVRFCQPKFFSQEIGACFEVHCSKRRAPA